MEEREGFDHVLDRLRTVVERLEQGSLSLEESLRIFEEGIALTRRGHKALDEAEQRVELLMRGPDGDVVQPFRADDGPKDTPAGQSP